MRCRRRSLWVLLRCVPRCLVCRVQDLSHFLGHHFSALDAGKLCAPQHLRVLLSGFAPLVRGGGAAGRPVRYTLVRVAEKRARLTLFFAYVSQSASISACATSGVCDTCKGVCPDLFAIFTSACFSSSSWTTSRWPLSEAKYSAVPWLCAHTQEGSARGSEQLDAAGSKAVRAR